MSRGPRGDGARITTDDRIGREQRIEVMRHHLGLQGQIHAVATLVHERVPLLDVLLSFFEKGSLLLFVNQRKQGPQNIPALSDQADFDRIPQADPGSIKIDLDPFGLSWLGIEFQIGEAAARDDQSVTVFKRFLRRRSAQQTDAACRIRTVVWNDGLPQEGFDNRRTDSLR